MVLSPRILLSNLAREKCKACLRDQPQLFIQSGAISEPKAAVLLPLCVVNEEVHILYTLRSSALKTHSGQVSFPGGKIDNGEDIIDTALRETKEEIGITRDAIDVWCTMSAVQGRDKNMLIKPVVGVIKDFEKRVLVPNSHEVEEVFTVSISTLCDPHNHAHLLYDNYALPIFLAGKHKIWGITGLITHLFLQCFIPSDSYSVDFMRKKFDMNELLPSKL
ncbi:nucleoside diphosphate-linked moiety X motif 8-like [Zerene cesonia]|uniref:nucleoside diphosphate-linked moiety X motif 8-like n=1 Tax=Zerene cesonia TaxID=33412 RepID=UPI0018E59956|nr:nucleoside diphosphate-linked moiety X motif 8-like [Zerene cesonia]XP_038222510.1 nucleoside diphosphate-linked moiety X motif 8-like [Zerene cesonia]